MPNPESYNPTETFHHELDTQQKEAVNVLGMTLDQKMAWSERASSNWAKAAENRIPAVLQFKAAEVTSEIKKIEASQMGDFDELEMKQLKDVQKQTFGLIQERVLLMVELAAMQAENQPVGSDKTVSTHTELAKLREVESLIERIDVQQMVYNALPPEMQAKYLESVGREFPADFYPILKKLSDHIELDEKDYTLLVDQIRKLGGSKDAMAQSSVMIVLGLISPKERTVLLTKMAEQDSFPNFEQVLLSMVGTTYVSTLQASEALDARTKYLEEKKKTSKPREDRVIDKEINSLSETRTVVNSEKMKETQKAALTLQAEASKYYGSRSYGHKDFAKDLLTVRGVGSLLLTINGAMTMGANIAMNATDPLSILSNSMVWLGAGEMAAGLQWGRGQGGLLPTPEEIAAKLIKGKNEEKDDRMTEYTQALKKDINNSYRESYFYATYAERIALVYKAKKPKFPDRTVPLTLADIGVSKKEDLPPDFQDLWEHKDKLEAKISEWAQDFSMIDVEKGQKATEWDTQRKFIEDTRAEESSNPMQYVDLPFFEYHSTQE